MAAREYVDYVVRESRPALSVEVHLEEQHLRWVLRTTLIAQLRNVSRPV